MILEVNIVSTILMAFQGGVFREGQGSQQDLLSVIQTLSGGEVLLLWLMDEKAAFTSLTAGLRVYVCVCVSHWRYIGSVSQCSPCN